MPTYEYKCESCGLEFEKFQKISDEPKAACPECEGKGLRLMSAGAGIISKGGKAAVPSSCPVGAPCGGGGDMPCMQGGCCSL